MITLKGICKEYELVGGTVTALKDVDLIIERGEYVAVMGPSGSGKSTLLHILGILDTATSGQYLLEDYDITSLPDREHARIRNKHFGFIFQSFNLFSELSALENVMLPMGYAGVPFRKRRERAELLLSEVGLSHRLHHLPTMMSGGEQQRVAIARALANDPDVILADEPTGNLPSDRGEEIMNMLESLNQKGVTILMVTHNPEQGKRAHRRLSIKDGMIIGDESKKAAAREAADA
jgi:putative ABC transport system ATP-binding protein